MANWAEAHGIQTVGELIALDRRNLIHERNLGRKTIAETSALIQEKLGRSWDELRHDETQSSPELDIARWASFLETPVQRLTFPTRLLNWSEKASVNTIHELLLWMPVELVRQPNVGRTTVRDARELIETELGCAWEEARQILQEGPPIPKKSPDEFAQEEREEREQRFDQGFLTVLKGALLNLETIPRMIVTRRAGLGGEPETLEEIAETLGVSRERVRQIEKKTWDTIQRVFGFVEYVEGQCQQAAPGGAIPLDELVSIPWWSGFADDPSALDYFLDKILDERWHVFEVEGRPILARCTQKNFYSSLTRAKQIAKSQSYPLPMGEVESAVRTQLEELPSAVRELIWEATRSEIACEGSGSEARALSYGDSKAAQILAFLERQHGPVSVNDLARELGRCVLPDEVFHFDRGVVGLERHFPDFKKWKTDLAPIAIRLIQQNGPERQWACVDLLPSVAEEIDLPDWFGHWHLAALLRRSEGVEYLGRNRVALPGAIQDSNRIHAHDAVEKILEDAGSPLEKEEIAHRLRQKLDISEIAFIGVLNRPIFLKIDKRRWGLLARDLPGGVEAMDDALDELETVLEQRQRGLAARFVHQEIQKISAIYRDWTEEICLSRVRTDPRFRVAISGTVGLATWESTRVPTRIDLVREALERSGGRVGVQAVREQIESLYGEAPERVHIGQMANRFGFRLDGEWLVKV